MGLSTLLCLVLLWGNLDNVESALSGTYEDNYSLREALLSNYSRDLLPLSNLSHRLDVNVNLLVYRIPEMDQVEGRAKIVMTLVMTWTDERLTWTPSDYGGIEYICISINDIWTPPIGHATMMEEFGINERDRVSYMYNGMALWKPAFMLENSCDFNMQFWPFDHQTCIVVFYIMDYMQDMVLLTTSGKGVNMDLYTQNAEWKLMDAWATPLQTQNISQLYYSFRLKREAGFYVFNMILPMGLIGFMSTCAFLIPNESGERMGYSITMMLAMAVFMTLIADQLPKSSEPLSLMCVYVMLLMMYCIMTVMMAIASSVLFARCDDIPIGLFYRRLYDIAHFKRPRGKSQVEGLKSKPVDDNNGRENENKTAWVDEKDDKKRSDEELNWVTVSKALDRIFFAVLTPILVLMTFIMLVYVSAAATWAPVELV